MRSHGWGGSPPRDATDARDRIIDAAMRCIDRYGPNKTGLSDVALELRVTRQTVYRYFPGVDELFTAVTEAAADGYLDRLAVHLSALRDPAELFVEGLAYTLERLPVEPYLGLLLSAERSQAFSRGVVSPAAFTFGRRMLARMPVDWRAQGQADGDLDDLVEFGLRMLQSLALDAPGSARHGAELRRFLTKWVAPAIRSNATGGVR